MAQNILEHCCYEYARQSFPSKLEDLGLDCAEAAELTNWTRIIIEHSFVAERTKNVLTSVHLLRHTAVHRRWTTARGVSKLIQRALKFTEALNDPARTLQLEES